jgi:hypothetical protein
LWHRKPFHGVAMLPDPHLSTLSRRAITVLRYESRVLWLRTKGLQWVALVAKANFDPTQPRVRRAALMVANGLMVQEAQVELAAATQSDAPCTGCGWLNTYPPSVIGCAICTPMK